MKSKILAVTILIFLLITSVHAFPLSTEDTEITDALDFLRTCQRDNGGFGEEGRDPNPGTSTWAIMTIAAAGEDPATWKVNGNSTIDYLESLSEETVAIDGTSETAKMIMTVVSVGKDPRDFTGVNFVELLKKKMKPDGQFGDHIYTTSWAVIALAAAGEDVSGSVKWLKSRQNEDGGFPWTTGADSDSDDTASSLEALIAGGEPKESATVQKALDYLRNAQDNSGGFNYGGSSSANAASDAWVIQALAAAGENPASWDKNGVNPVSHLLALQQKDGSFKWTTLLTDNPCRMTASAIPALLGKPYPIIPGQESQILPESTPAAAATQTSGPAATVQPAKTGTDNSRTVTITDDFGNLVTIHGIPQRIVSLAPSNTEILFALGIGDRVVGVTDYCNYPPEAESIEKVGGYSSPNVEKIVNVNPDVIIAALGNTQEAADHLKELGFTVIALNPKSIEDVMGNIKIIGEATGTAEKANEIVEDMQNRIQAVKDATAGVTDKPSVAHVVWYDPIWVSGNNTFQNEMFEMAAGKNAFVDVEGWAVVSMEKFITSNPDIIIVNTGSGMGESGKDIIYDYFMNEPRLQNLNAVKNNRIYLVDSDIIDRGSPRIVDALESVAEDIHPDLFGQTESKETPATSSPGFGIAAIAGMLTGMIVLRATKKQ